MIIFKDLITSKFWVVCGRHCIVLSLEVRNGFFPRAFFFFFFGKTEGFVRVIARVTVLFGINSASNVIFQLL